jgi:PAS domain S-box-containing protein
VEQLNWEAVAAVVGALVGFVTILYRAPKAFQQLKKWWNNMFGVGNIKTDLAALSESVSLVVSELRPNGGASIRDSLNRIEIRQVLQEQRQKAILSDMSVGVFETDTSGDFIWVNRKYLRMTGRAPDEVKGSGWINTVAHRDRERVVMSWNKAMEEEREFEEEFTLITPDDNRCKVQVRTYKMSEDDSPIGYIGMVTPLCDMGRTL